MAGNSEQMKMRKDRLEVPLAEARIKQNKTKKTLRNLKIESKRKLIIATINRK